MFARLTLAVVAGLVLSFGFEPVTLPWVMPFALAAFWLTLRGTTGWQGCWLGLAFGGGFMYVHIFWMTSVGWDAYLLLATALMLYHGLLGAVGSSMMRYRWWPLALPVAWVATEWLRSTWPFSGMPWGRLSYGVIDTPLASALPYLGATGVSLVVALLASLIAWTVVYRRRWHVGVAALAGVCVLITVPVLQSWEPTEAGSVDVAVVQGNVPGDGSDILLDHRQVTQNHVDATIDLAEQVDAGERPRPDFVLWPENSTAVDPVADGSTRAGITEAAQAIGVPILVGAMVDAGDRKILNQGIVWDPVTGPGERYTKHNPVPFGEYLPFRSVLDGWNLGRLHDIPSDMQAGSRVEPLDIADTPVADVICFDIAYDAVLYDQMTHGAQVLTVQTSNATFIHTDQLDQQYAITRVRALELGRSVYVASPNGLTGIIGADGATVQQAERRTTAVLQAEMPQISSVTPAVRLGEWPARLSALAVLAYIVIHLAFKVRGYRRRRASARAVAGTAPAPPTEPSEASHR